MEWYVFVIDIDDPSEKPKYNELIYDLAQEVCVSTLAGDLKTQDYYLMDFNDTTVNVAHLQANFKNPENADLNRFYTSVGRFAFTLSPAFAKTSKALYVNCGQPSCGQPVNDGNDPFAVFSQGHNYQRPSKGQKADAAELRIVGGQDARPTKWPFTLSLHRNGYFKCGASIISPDWILTAAHCVYDFKNRGDYFEVRLFGSNALFMDFFASNCKGYFLQRITCFYICLP